jgi:hypothetical protein
MSRFRRADIMNDMERIESNMLRVCDEPLQVRVETFNRLMVEFLSKHGSPGIQERLGRLMLYLCRHVIQDGENDEQYRS